MAQDVEPECSARLHSDDRAGPHVRTGDEQRASADSEDSTGTPPKHEGRPWERQIVSGTAIEGNDESGGECLGEDPGVQLQPNRVPA